MINSSLESLPRYVLYLTTEILFNFYFITLARNLVLGFIIRGKKICFDMACYKFTSFTLLTNYFTAVRTVTQNNMEQLTGIGFKLTNALVENSRITKALF